MGYTIARRSILFQLASLITVLLVLESGAWVKASSQSLAARAGSGSNAAGQGKEEIRTLEPGEPIERELAGGQGHTYQILLNAGQFVNVTVEQRGIDVVVRLLGPDGKQIAEFDFEIRKQGQEAVSQVAEVAGSYRLNVQAKEKGAAAGRYQIRVVELRAATEKDRELQEAGKLLTEALRLSRAGKYDEARPLAERALEIREKALGPEHPDVAASLNTLANLYHAKGDYAKAEPLFQRALAIREKALGPEHPNVVASLNNLANLHYNKGDYAKAEPLHQRALAIREKALGLEHPDVAQSLNNLALLYRDKGDYAKAEPLFQRAVAITEKALMPEHPNVALTLNNLAILYSKKGDYAKAEPLYQRALAIWEKALGPEHPHVAASLNNLANLYHDKGDYAKAEPLYQRALAIWEKALGPEHPDVAASLNSLANLYRDKGDYSKAEPLDQRALAIREKALGPEHPEVALPLNNLAILYAKKGDYAKAEPLYQRALAIREKALGPEHPDVAASLNNLANLYHDKGDYSKAEPLDQRALAISEKAFGPEHPEVTASLNNLANLYRDKGDYSKAEPLYQRALAIREKALGPDHPSVADSLNNLTILHSDKGDYAKVESLHQRALAIREKALGPEHPDVAASLNNLAILYRNKGDYAKVEPLLQRALAIREKALGLEHPDLAFPLNNLALLYSDKGDYARAEPLYQRALAILEKTRGPGHLYVASSLNGLAKLYTAKGDLAQAVTFQLRASAVSERNLALNLTTGSERQKLAYLATLSGQTNRTISLHVHTAPNDPAARSLAATTILQRKGRVLDATSDGLGALRRRFNAQDQALLDRLKETNAQLARLVLGGPQRISPTEHQKQIKALEEQKEEIEAAISSRSAEFRAQSQPVTLEAVQSAIPGNAALIEFFGYRPFNAKYTRPDDQFGQPRYVAYVLRRRGAPRWVELGEAKAIDDAVATWRQALRNPRRADVHRLARQVDERVMRPVRALLGETSRILISPDGSLNLIPFAALVDDRGRYLVERYSFSHMSSGRDLLRLQVLAQSKQGPFIIADPAFGDLAGVSTEETRGLGLQSDLKQPATQGPSLAQVYFRPLPRTAEEAQTLKSILPQSRLLTGKQATEAALKQVSGPSILHIATHGFFLKDLDAKPANERGLGLLSEGQTAISEWQSAGANLRIENPLLLSGLALAGANQRKSGEDDGVLTALEAAGLDLWGTKLVVLSACDTGVGEIKNGEGVYGLRRALVLAGSESQVMSLWPVPDKSTRDLMVAYYRALAQGQGRSEALREVQLETLKSKNRQHPYYWASFIQSGEWANLEGKR